MPNVKKLLAAWAAAGCLLVLGQGKYTGPRPPEPDMVYLVHASNLIATEHSQAREEQRRDRTANLVEGASSPVRTPLAEPIFLVETRQLQAEKLQLFQMDVRSGRREVVFSNDPRRSKDDPQPKKLIHTRLEPGLYRVEASEILENGEYCLSPSGAMDVFCFQVY